MTRSRVSPWATVVILIFAVATFGCSSASTTPSTVKDMASLAGVWNGWVRLPTGQQVPATFDLKPAGDYVVQGGAFITRGKAQLKDGGLLLVSSDATGVLAIGERTSTAQLGERAGNWVLTGAGRGDAGPFNFEVSRPK